MSAQTAERQRQRRLRAMARALWTGDRVGAEAARAEGLDADLARSAPARLNEDGTTALGLVSGADARGLLGLVSGAHAQRLEPHASAPSTVSTPGSWAATVDYYVIKYMAKPLDLRHMRRTLAQPVDRASLESLEAVSEDDDECWRFLPVGVPAHYERDILNLDEVD